MGSGAHSGCLSVYISIYLSVSLSALYVCPSIRPCVHLMSSIYISVFLSVYPCTYLPVCLSIRPYTYLRVYLIAIMDPFSDDEAAGARNWPFTYMCCRNEECSYVLLHSQCIFTFWGLIKYKKAFTFVLWRHASILQGTVSMSPPFLGFSDLSLRLSIVVITSLSFKFFLVPRVFLCLW
jgi:hypothetical protein